MKVGLEDKRAELQAILGKRESVCQGDSRELSDTVQFIGGQLGEETVQVEE